MKLQLFITLFLLIGCASINKSHIKINRVPAEVTDTNQENSPESPVFRERSFELFRNLEIPPGSSFKRKDIDVVSDSCTVTFSRDSKNNYEYLADFGIYTGLDKSAQAFGWNTPSLPITMGCPNGVCEFISEYVPAPHNMVQIAKIWVDPYFQNVTRMEMEIRKGPKGMAPENMALQLKSTCTPEFIGM